MPGRIEANRFNAAQRRDLPISSRRGKKNSFETKEFSQARISLARTVLEYSLEDAKNVLAGTMRLDEAYAEAKLIKERNDELPARLERLCGIGLGRSCAGRKTHD